MTFKSWPGFLPQKSLLQGYADSVADGRIESQSTTGIGKRRAFWVGLRRFHVSLNLSQSRWVTLTSFWNVDLRNGIDPFIIIDHTQSGYLTIDGEIVTIEGQPIYSTVPILVQFPKDGGPRITETFTADLFRVEFDLEVLP